MFAWSMDDDEVVDMEDRFAENRTDLRPASNHNLFYQKTKGFLHDFKLIFVFNFKVYCRDTFKWILFLISTLNYDSVLKKRLNFRF